MAAAGQIRDMIQAALDTLTGRYDERLDRLEERVAALESGAPAARKTTARKTPPAVQAQAGVAEVKGEAPTP